jgi:hypothetical protein
VPIFVHTLKTQVTIKIDIIFVLIFFMLKSLAVLTKWMKMNMKIHKHENIKVYSRIIIFGHGGSNDGNGFDGLTSQKLLFLFHSDSISDSSLKILILVLKVYRIY